MRLPHTGVKIKSSPIQRYVVYGADIFFPQLPSPNNISVVVKFLHLYNAIAFSFDLMDNG